MHHISWASHTHIHTYCKRRKQKASLLYTSQALAPLLLPQLSISNAFATDW